MRDSDFECHAPRAHLLTDDDIELNVLNRAPPDKRPRKLKPVVNAATERQTGFLLLDKNLPLQQTESIVDTWAKDRSRPPDLEAAVSGVVGVMLFRGISHAKTALSTTLSPPAGYVKSNVATDVLSCLAF